MFSRIIYYLGIVACVTLIIACFLPWATYNDIHKTFNGFYSFENYYGKPGKFLTLMTSIALFFMILPKIWAKRANLFICALTTGYAIYAYTLYSTCYKAYCPQREIGLFLMVGSACIMLLASILPDHGIRKR